MFCDCPRPNNCAPRPVVVEAISRAEVAGLFSRSEGILRLAAKLPQHGEIIKGQRDTERVCSFPRQCQPRLCCLKGALRITEVPIAVADISAAKHPHIDAVDLGVVAPRAFACGHALVKTVASALECAHVIVCSPSEEMRFGEGRRIAASLRKVDHFSHEPIRIAQIGAYVIDITKSPQRGEEIDLVAEFPAQLLGTPIYSLRFAGSEALRGEERSA